MATTTRSPRTVRTRLGEALQAMVAVDGPLAVVSGLRLGAEQLGAEAALVAGLPLVAVLPYPQADKPWPAESRQRFAELVAAADVAVTLEAKAPASKQLAGAAVGRRVRMVGPPGRRCPRGVGSGGRRRRPPGPVAGGPPRSRPGPPAPPARPVTSPGRTGVRKDPFLGPFAPRFGCSRPGCTGYLPRADFVLGVGRVDGPDAGLARCHLGLGAADQAARVVTAGHRAVGLDDGIPGGAGVDLEHRVGIRGVERGPAPSTGGGGGGAAAG